ncbi:sensor histidine kinase [Paraburkholderia sp. BCC1886]|uniref:sensor histidine kinase n=1 Tax=Paraburkholderia sp. BCC1886 TaxID=2562670 RepID=UPI0021B24843|nr:hypothetical protein [Paraburkholderia sp. BCC1886]
MFAFIFLCVFFIRANVAVSSESVQYGTQVHEVPPMVTSEARDAFASTGGSGSGSDSAVTSTSAAQDVVIERQTWLLTLAAPVAVALAGACLSRAALRSVAEKHERLIGEWETRCKAAQAAQAAQAVQAAQAAQAAQSIEQAANLTAVQQATQQASASAQLDRLWLLGLIRTHAEAPLTAITGLLDALGATMPSAEARTELQWVQSAMRTWTQALADLLDASSLESRAFVLDESVTHVREVIGGVIALLTPSAAQQGMRLSVSVESGVAEAILADGTRLGQVFFYMVNRAIQSGSRGDIALVVRAEPATPGNQRIFFSLEETGAGAPSVAQASSRQPGSLSPSAQSAYADFCVPLCKLLAQRMRGEFSVSGIHASFNADFPVEQRKVQTSRAAHVERASSANTDESIERRYLDSLADEGVDIPTFLGDWRDAMNDDIERLGVLRHEGAETGIQALLHRLSGAVGLIGARDLMEALRQASVERPPFDASALDTLTARTTRLVAQLEAVPDSRRSTL